MRGTDDEVLLIVTNFDDSTRQCSVNIPTEAFAYFGAYGSSEKVIATELISGEEFETYFTPEKLIELTLPGNNGVILKFKTK